MATPLGTALTQDLSHLSPSVTDSFGFTCSSFTKTLTPEASFVTISADGNVLTVFSEDPNDVGYYASRFRSP